MKGPLGSGAGIAFEILAQRVSHDIRRRHATIPEVRIEASFEVVGKCHRQSFHDFILPTRPRERPENQITRRKMTKTIEHPKLEFPEIWNDRRLPAYPGQALSAKVRTVELRGDGAELIPARHIPRVLFDENRSVVRETIFDLT